ncbi:MAG: hypothetical protein HZC02_00585 [Candidatus Levybacteria bacterium]|nr:hypothetical protein [Candidatus Levybacteria bacterium]
MKKDKIILTVFSATLLPFAVSTAHAETLTITGNGDGSSSDVSISQSHDVHVSQENNAEVNNDVNVLANTGDNSASNNTGGDTAVTTGNISTDTTIANSMNNSDITAGACCDNHDSQAIISGNGANSINTVGYTSITTSAISINQQATITNNISGTAITGNNNANNNNGNVAITTGNITVEESIKNKTNLAIVNALTGGNGGFQIKISGNGEGSVNTITLREDTSTTIAISNVSDIFNHSIWNLITGNNNANGNNGDVAIKTGDIHVSIDVDNQANQSEVTVDCGCKEPPPPPPCEGDGCNPPPPPPPSGNGGNPPSSGGNGGGTSNSVLGTTTGEVLPATGNPWILLAILGNLLMLFFGVLLRLRSGRSPGAFAI